MKTADEDTTIEIHRNNFFEDAYNGILSRSPQELKKRLNIIYIGEKGLNTKGLLR